jgi:hypothetical protein
MTHTRNQRRSLLTLCVDLNEMKPATNRLHACEPAPKRTLEIAKFFLRSPELAADWARIAITSVKVQ